MERDVDRVQQRARRYWADDGLAEIAAGCIFVLVGLLFFVEASAVPGSPLARISAFGLPILLIAGMAVARWLVRTAKAHLTYPRTGFVAYRRPSAGRRLLTGVAAGVMGVLAASILRWWPNSLAWTPTLTALPVSLFLLYIGHTLGLARFHLLAILSALAGVVAALGGLADTLGSAVYFSSMGTLFVASGGITLRSYLSRTQPPAEE